jgi:hypothetical protein
VESGRDFGIESLSWLLTGYLSVEEGTAHIVLVGVSYPPSPSFASSRRCCAFFE